MIQGLYTKKNHCLDLEDYSTKIYQECEKTMPHPKKLDKISNDNIVLPSFNNYEIILKYNYNAQQLKDIAKKNKLKVTGNKQQLINRIYVFLKLSSFVLKIQKVWRGKLQRIFNEAHGPAYKNRKVCTNATDFFTMDDLDDLPLFNLFLLNLCCGNLVSTILAD
jgi:hypothetical protein